MVPSLAVILASLLAPSASASGEGRANTPSSPGKRTVIPVVTPLSLNLKADLGFAPPIQGADTQGPQPLADAPLIRAAAFTVIPGGPPTVGPEALRRELEAATLKTQSLTETMAKPGADESEASQKARHVFEAGDEGTAADGAVLPGGPGSGVTGASLGRSDASARGRTRAQAEDGAHLRMPLVWNRSRTAPRRGGSFQVDAKTGIDPDAALPRLNEMIGLIGDYLSQRLLSQNPRLRDYALARLNRVHWRVGTTAGAASRAGNTLTVSAAHWADAPAAVTAAALAHEAFHFLTDSSGETATHVVQADFYLWAAARLKAQGRNLDFAPRRPFLDALLDWSPLGLTKRGKTFFSIDRVVDSFRRGRLAQERIDVPDQYGQAGLRERALMGSDPKTVEKTISTSEAAGDAEGADRGRILLAALRLYEREAKITLPAAPEAKAPPVVNLLPPQADPSFNPGPSGSSGTQKLRAAQERLRARFIQKARQVDQRGAQGLSPEDKAALLPSVAAEFADASFTPIQRAIGVSAVLNEFSRAGILRGKVLTDPSMEVFYEASGGGMVRYDAAESRFDRVRVNLNEFRGRAYALRIEEDDRFDIVPGGAVAQNVSKGRAPREVIVIDFARDAALRAFRDQTVLGEARRRGLLGTPGSERALVSVVYEMIRAHVPYRESVANAFARQGGELLIGSTIGQGGVCRHQGLLAAALLEWLIAQKHLPASAWVSYDRGPGHGWATYHASDGSALVVDAAQGHLGSPAEGRYDYQPYVDKNAGIRNDSLVQFRAAESMLMPAPVPAGPKIPSPPELERWLARSLGRAARHAQAYGPREFEVDDYFKANPKVSLSHPAVAALYAEWEAGRAGGEGAPAGLSDRRENSVDGPLLIRLVAARRAARKAAPAPAPAPVPAARPPASPEGAFAPADDPNVAKVLAEIEGFEKELGAGTADSLFRVQGGRREVNLRALATIQRIMKDLRKPIAPPTSGEIAHAIDIMEMRSREELPATTTRVEEVVRFLTNDPYVSYELPIVERLDREFTELRASQGLQNAGIPHDYFRSSPQGPRLNVLALLRELKSLRADAEPR